VPPCWGLKVTGHVIETISLVKVYESNGVKTYALRGVNMRIFDGDFVAVVGPSGCGKSTLLNMIGGLDRPTSGRVMIDGIDVSTMNDNELAELRNKKIGFVFQAYNLLPRMSVLRNVELPLMARGTPPAERKRKALEVLKDVGLAEKAHARPTQLSGGEQQRVAIARALVTEPKILLADEPTGNLDSKSAHDIVNIFKSLNDRGRTIVVVTHNMEVAEAAKRVIRLRDGMIEKEEVLRSE